MRLRKVNLSDGIYVYHIVDSPDDNGYYAELFKIDEKHTYHTDVYLTLHLVMVAIHNEKFYRVD